MTNWEKIHRDFKYYQQLWEQEGLTYPEAQQWIQAGFEPKDYEKIKQWKIHHFTPSEAKSWKKIKLT